MLTWTEKYYFMCLKIIKMITKTMWSVYASFTVLVEEAEENNNNLIKARLF